MNKIHHRLPDENGTNQYILQSSAQKAAPKRKGTSVIYAGNLKMPNQDAMNVKLRSQKKALKSILDEYKNDSKLDNNIEQRKEHQQKLRDYAGEAAGMVEQLRSQRKNLMDAFAVSNDSGEESDLRLLEKSIYSDDPLTNEELAKLKEIGPLTDYQKGALEIDAMEQVWLQRIDDAKNGIINDEKSITGIKLARVKTHPMVDAQIEATKIIEAAGKKVINMLVDDAKQEFDETLKENIEKAQKQQEENKKKEEKVEQAKEEEKKQQEINEVKAGLAPETSITPEAVPTGSDPSLITVDLLQQELQTNLANIVKKQNLLPEELKGIVVDELL